MATVGSSSIKVSGAVSGQVTSSGTLYTCPANSYAIVQVGFIPTSNAHARILIAGRHVIQNEPTVAGNYPIMTASGLGNGICGPYYVGPGQSVTVTALSGGGNCVTCISGVEFTNT